MRTILFISFLLLLWCGFSSFESTSVRPNGWYYVIDMEHDSLSADPIVTVKDFARIKLDSVSDSNEDNMAYRILGVLDDSHKTTWAEATEKSMHVTFELIGEWGVEIVPVALLFILMFFSLLETQEVSFPSPLISMFADSHL